MPKSVELVGPPFINLNSIFATVTTDDTNWNKSALRFVGNLAML